MREKIVNVYIFIVLMLFNAMSLNLNILGLKIENLLLLIVAIGVFVVIVKLNWRQRPTWREISVPDWITGILLVSEIGWIVYKLIALGSCGDEDILLLILLLSYFIIHTYKGRYYNYLFAFSIANMAIYITLLYNAVTGEQKIFMGGYLLQDRGILSWLVLSIVTGIAAYCTDKHLCSWYGVQILVGSFLLFLQKNFLSIGIVGITFLLVLFFAPFSKGIVKKVGMLFFGYAFLFINMSFIVNYIGFLQNPVPYSISVSVYLNVALSVVLIFACILWDKWNKVKDAEALIGRRVRIIVKTLLILAGVSTLFMMTQLLSGNMEQSSEVLTKLLNYKRAGFAANKGIIPTMVEDCGVIGIFAIAYLLYFALTLLLWGYKAEKRKNFWIYMVLSVIYCLQTIGLSQSIRITFLYAVFLFIGLTENRLKNNSCDHNIGEELS